MHKRMCLLAFVGLIYIMCFCLDGYAQIPVQQGNPSYYYQTTNMPPSLVPSGVPAVFHITKNEAANADAIFGAAQSYIQSTGPATVLVDSDVTAIIKNTYNLNNAANNCLNIIGIGADATHSIIQYSITAKATSKPMFYYDEGSALGTTGGSGMNPGQGPHGCVIQNIKFDANGLAGGWVYFGKSYWQVVTNVIGRAAATHGQVYAANIIAHGSGGTDNTYSITATRNPNASYIDKNTQLLVPGPGIDCTAYPIVSVTVSGGKLTDASVTDANSGSGCDAAYPPYIDLTTTGIQGGAIAIEVVDAPFLIGGPGQPPPGTPPSDISPGVHAATLTNLQATVGVPSSFSGFQAGSFSTFAHITGPLGPHEIIPAIDTNNNVAYQQARIFVYPTRYGQQALTSLPALSANACPPSSLPLFTPYTGMQAPIVSYQIVGNVATITITPQQKQIFNPNDQIIISGVQPPNNFLNSTYTIQQVLTNTTFTIPLTHVNAASTAQGTVTSYTGAWTANSNQPVSALQVTNIGSCSSSNGVTVYVVDMDSSYYGFHITSAAPDNRFYHLGTNQIGTVASIRNDAGQNIFYGAHPVGSPIGVMSAADEFDGTECDSVWRTCFLPEFGLLTASNTTSFNNQAYFKPFSLQYVAVDQVSESNHLYGGSVGGVTIENLLSQGAYKDPVTFSGGGCTTTPTAGTGVYSGGSTGSLLAVPIMNPGLGCTSPPTVTPTVASGSPSGQTLISVMGVQVSGGGCTVPPMINTTVTAAGDVSAVTVDKASLNGGGQGCTSPVTVSSVGQAAGEIFSPIMTGGFRGTSFMNVMNTPHNHAVNSIQTAASEGDHAPIFYSPSANSWYGACSTCANSSMLQGIQMLDASPSNDLVENSMNQRELFDLSDTVFTGQDISGFYSENPQTDRRYNFGAPGNIERPNAPGSTTVKIPEARVTIANQFVGTVGPPARTGGDSLDLVSTNAGTTGFALATYIAAAGTMPSFGTTIDYTGTVSTHFVKGTVPSQMPMPGGGAGAGTASFLITPSTDSSGAVQVVTADTPAANSIIVTINFGSQLATPSTANCTFSPLNGSAAGVSGTVFISATSTGFSLRSGATPLASGTTYQWGYHCSE